MRPVVLRARAMPVMTRAQAADAAAWQQHETLGGLIAQLRQLERDVGSEAYVVYYNEYIDLRLRRNRGGLTVPRGGRPSGPGRVKKKTVR